MGGCCTKPKVVEIQQLKVLKFRDEPFSDNYEQVKVLGRGANGEVKLIKNKITGEEYALKIICPPFNEAEIYSNLKHEHIVELVELYLDKKQNRVYMVLELMRGGTLFDYWSKRQLTEREAAKIIHDLGLAIKYLHSANITHRDIKPENILYDSNGVLKLSDFGFAKKCGQGELCHTVCYTLPYASPEVLEGTPYDKQCDMWAVGVLLYYLLCGQLPFPSNGCRTHRNPQENIDFESERWKYVSDEAKSLVKRMLVTNPEQRLKIDELMSDDWIRRYEEAPGTPLPLTTNGIGRRTRKKLEVVLRKNLEAMRAKEFFIKPAEELKNNRLLARRRKITDGAAANLVDGITASEPTPKD